MRRADRMTAPGDLLLDVDMLADVLISSSSDERRRACIMRIASPETRHGPGVRIMLLDLGSYGRAMEPTDSVWSPDA